LPQLKIDLMISNNIKKKLKSNEIDCQTVISFLEDKKKLIKKIEITKNLNNQTHYNNQKNYNNQPKYDEKWTTPIDRPEMSVFQNDFYRPTLTDF
jgi:hypothetical protein